MHSGGSTCTREEPVLPAWHGLAVPHSLGGKQPLGGLPGAQLRWRLHTRQNNSLWRTRPTETHVTAGTRFNPYCLSVLLILINDDL